MTALADLAKVLTPKSVRRSLLNARMAVRRPTSSQRVLPDFMLIGTMRGGTSSLFKYLSAHPLVIPSLRKETWYFSDPELHSRGELWYRSHFPTKQYMSCLSLIKGSDPLVFEASANYLYYPDVPELASRTVPSAKLIVLLRNPTERLYSHYQHNIRRGAEKRPLQKAIDLGLQMIDKEKRSVVYGDEYDAQQKRSFHYFSMGFYADQLEQWWKYFPRENMLILKSEDFFKNTDQLYARVVRFLGLREWTPSTFRNYSYWGNSKTPEPVEGSELSDSIRSNLNAYFVPHNTRLKELLGPDFAWDAASLE